MYKSVIALLLGTCSLGVNAHCKQNYPGFAVPKAYPVGVNLSQLFPYGATVAEQSFTTEFSGLMPFICSSSLSNANKVLVSSPLYNKAVTVGFNQGSDYVQIEVNYVSLPERTFSSQGGSYFGYTLNTNFRVKFTKVKHIADRTRYISVPGPVYEMPNIIIASDATGYSILELILDMVLRFLQYIANGFVWPANEKEIYYQPLKVVYTPRMTTCTFNNDGLQVKLPEVSRAQLLATKKTGYTPFSLSFHCQDLINNKLSSRAIRVFLASDYLHQKDETLLVNQRGEGANGLGFRLEKRSGELITLSRNMNEQGAASALFSVVPGGDLNSNFSVDLAAYYYPFNKEKLSPGKLSSSAVVVVSYD